MCFGSILCQRNLPSTEQKNMTESKVAIVTGSASGVGAATCLQLAQKGWNVVVNYSRSKEEAKETAAKCREFGHGVLLVKGDVSQDNDCIQLVEAATKAWGRIDALVNNAGRTKFCDYDKLDGLSTDDFLQLYEVNVVGAYQMTRACAPYLKEMKGVVVNTSSISAMSGVGSSIAYAASKGALSTMTLSLAHALAPNVRVNAVNPGFIDGRWTRKFLAERYEEVSSRIAAGALLNKVATPEDIAKTIVYLIVGAVASTGQILVVDNGQLGNHGGLS